MKKILVTGSNGQLGKELRQLAPLHNEFSFIFLSREDLPIHHFDMVRTYFDNLQPDFCINCAAYTAVDRAEQEKDLAFQVNGEAVGVLAAVCKKYHTRLIHISTDYVFDGNGTQPWKETDPVSPVNTYGASKLQGEEEAMQFNPETIIIRTSWVYSRFGKNFVRTMLKLMKEKKEISVVNDQLGSPTYAADLATAILHIINQAHWHSGIYHYCNEGIISWYDFAAAIKEISGSDCLVHPIPTHQYPTPAKRPAYSALNTGKIKTRFNLAIPGWKESLIGCLKQLEE